MSQPEIETDEPRTPLPRNRLRRRLVLGCLVPFLVLCAALGLVTSAVIGGPVEINLPGAAVLKLGHDDFVLSNYSFQNGTTYFIDLKGTDVRDILELHVLPDTHKI